eukprot:580596-Amphidinium_carterae.1
MMHSSQGESKLQTDNALGFGISADHHYSSSLSVPQCAKKGSNFSVLRCTETLGRGPVLLKFYTPEYITLTTLSEWSIGLIAFALGKVQGVAILDNGITVNDFGLTSSISNSRCKNRPWTHHLLPSFMQSLGFGA